MAAMSARSRLTTSPPLRPATSASSALDSWARPCACAAFPPLLAISRCLPISIEANPRLLFGRSELLVVIFLSLESMNLKPIAIAFLAHTPDSRRPFGCQDRGRHLGYGYAILVRWFQCVRCRNKRSPDATTWLQGQRGGTACSGRASRQRLGKGEKSFRLRLCPQLSAEACCHDGAYRYGSARSEPARLGGRADRAHLAKQDKRSGFSGWIQNANVSGMLRERLARSPSVWLKLERETEGPASSADAQGIGLNAQARQDLACPVCEERRIIDTQRVVECLRGVLVERIQIQADADRHVRPNRVPLA